MGFDTDGVLGRHSESGVARMLAGGVLDVLDKFLHLQVGAIEEMAMHVDGQGSGCVRRRQTPRRNAAHTCVKECSGGKKHRAMKKLAPGKRIAEHCPPLYFRSTY